jgi:hypothetical protein
MTIKSGDTPIEGEKILEKMYYLLEISRLSSRYFLWIFPFGIVLADIAEKEADTADKIKI